MRPSPMSVHFKKAPHPSHRHHSRGSWINTIGKILAYIILTIIGVRMSFSLYGEYDLEGFLTKVSGKATCEDRDMNCHQYIEAGGCDTRPEWMLVNCAKSCKSCHLVDPFVRCNRKTLKISEKPVFGPGDFNRMLSGLKLRLSDKYRINVLSKAPYVATIDNFMSGEDIDSILATVTDWQEPQMETPDESNEEEEEEETKADNKKTTSLRQRKTSEDTEEGGEEATEEKSSDSAAKQTVTGKVDTKPISKPTSATSASVSTSNKDTKLVSTKPPSTANAATSAAKSPVAATKIVSTKPPVMATRNSSSFAKDAKSQVGKAPSGVSNSMKAPVSASKIVSTKPPFVAKNTSTVTRTHLSQSQSQNHHKSDLRFRALQTVSQQKERHENEDEDEKKHDEDEDNGHHDKHTRRRLAAARMRIPQSRPGSHAWCMGECAESEEVNEILTKLEEATFVPKVNMEHFQLLKFEKGQGYYAHMDADVSERILPCGPRILSVIIYLTDVTAGGETAFPNLNITVQPKKGRLLLFQNVAGDDPKFEAIDHKISHGGMPVEKGTKIIMKNFLHPYNFVESLKWDCLNHHINMQ